MPAPLEVKCIERCYVMVVIIYRYEVKSSRVIVVQVREIPILTGVPINEAALA